LASRVDSELQGVDVGNGVSLRKCLAFGRTMTYQYDVPSDWYPVDNMKEDLISNFKTAGFAKTYFDNDIDVDYYYFNGNRLEKKISIKSEEFAASSSSRKSASPNNQLGDYLSLKEHPKAKGVNLKIKVPIGWEVQEGDRPNVVVKFVKAGSNYLIGIKDNATFISRNEAKESFHDQEFKNSLIEEYSSIFQNPEILSDKIVTVDNYPALELDIKGSFERLGKRFGIRTKVWFILYEDKTIYFQGMGLDNGGYKGLSSFFNLISNSVIFPDQYD
jgi:hypothetical protein